jgi:rod shape-determining protein MreC
MNRSSIAGYAFLAFTVFVLISIPPKNMHRLRAKLVTKALNFTEKSNHYFEPKNKKLLEKVSALKEENTSLRLILNTTSTDNLSNSEAIMAKVVFRDPAFWSSSIMINKGFSDSPQIQKNCPILSSGYLIGVIEEVFPKISKVRLITDKNMQISVKKKGFIEHEDDLGLNMGTMKGSNSVEVRYRFKQVDGVFFSRNIQSQDILVTSGLDGVFPEGLPVAKIIEVKISDEEVEFPFKAQVCAPDIKYLKHVTILPSLD